MNTFGPTDFFGEMALLDDGLRTATVSASEATECLALTRWDFLGILKDDADMAVIILQELARRFRMALDRATVGCPFLSGAAQETGFLQKPGLCCRDQMDIAREVSAACGFESPAEMKFCGQMRHALGLACPSCGFVNPPTTVSAACAAAG